MVMKLAIVIFNRMLLTNPIFEDKVKFMATVHDEWQLECDPSVADLVGKAGVKSIVQSGERLGCKVPMDGEYRVGNNWSECH